MSKSITQSEKALPKIEDLYAHPAQIKKSNDLNILLNHEPNPRWLKDHPMAKGVKYIPIEIIEYLLTMIFVKWRVEVKSTQLVANSVLVTVRLHYKDPITGDWDFQDGLGAMPLQTDKGASATDFTKVKNDAVMKSAPAAESYAVKDAAEKLGKLFGKDLNRSSAQTYKGLSDRDLDPNMGLDNVDLTPKK